MFPTRFGVGSPARAEVGWALARLTPPRALYGAAGILFGPDGRLYVAQPNGSQLSAIDIASGAVDVVSPKGSELVAIDDLAIDSLATWPTYPRRCITGSQRSTRTAPSGG